MKAIGICALFLILALMLAGPALAQTEILVSPGESIQAAINSSSNGDIIVVTGPATYNEAIDINSLIHLIAAPDVTIQSTASPAVTFNSISDGSSISGFTITSTGSDGVVVQNGAIGVIVANNTIANCAGSGVSISGQVSNSVDNTVILGNIIEGNNNGILLNAGSSGPVEVYANDIRDNDVDGISRTQSNQAFFIIKNNLIRGNGNHGFHFNTSFANIQLGTTISNNVFFNNAQHGLFVQSSSSFNGPIPISNNIIVDNTFGIGIGGNQVAPNDLSLSYNDFFNNSGGDYNDGLMPGLDDISGDPLFTDPATDDFTLSPGSPAIDTGNPGPLESDLDRTRNDMGIYGGSFSWANYNANPNAVQILMLGLSDRSVNQGDDITITAKGVATQQ